MLNPCLNTPVATSNYSSPPSRASNCPFGQCPSRGCTARTSGPFFTSFWQTAACLSQLLPTQRQCQVLRPTTSAFTTTTGIRILGEEKKNKSCFKLTLNCTVLLRTVLMLSSSCKLQWPAELLSGHSPRRPWEARKRRRRMLAGGAAWQPACPAHPCLQPRRLRGCKLGKGSSMRTAICALGAVPRRVRGIISPHTLARMVSFPNARVGLTEHMGNISPKIWAWSCREVSKRSPSEPPPAACQPCLRLNPRRCL